MRGSTQTSTMTLSEYRRYCLSAGFPWCDTCENPVVWREGFGYQHASPERPLGIFRDQDTSGHTPTCRAWYNDSF